MTDRDLMQQVLRELEGIPFYRKYGVRISNAITALRNRLAHCDRCGKRLGGEGDIHTCTPDPIGDAQDKLIAEMAAQPEQEHVCIGWDDKTDTPIMGYTTPPAAQPAAPDFKAFKAWANDAGYDTAYTNDGVNWICLSPMTADLWKAWQAAHGIKENT